MRLLALSLLLPLCSHAQDTQHTAGYEPVGSVLVVGLGLGQPYGGIGVQLAARLWQPLELFAGGGYALAGTGINAGLRLRVAPNSPVCPFLTGMYGYNGAVYVKGTDRYNMLYYGPSFGGGVEIHGNRRPERHLSVQVIFPLRPQAFEDAVSALKRNPNVQVFAEPWDVSIAIGYHFGQ